MLALVSVLGIALAIARTGEAAVIHSASIESHGRLVELHFGVRGAGLRWHLMTHGEQLRLQIENARIEIPTRPLGGSETAPVKLVLAAAGESGGQIVIEVSGKVDYAAARMPHELIVRVAPSGTVRDIAAPLLVGMESTQAPAQVRQRPTRAVKTSATANSQGVNPARTANFNAHVADSFARSAADGSTSLEDHASGADSRLSTPSGQEYAATEAPRAIAHAEENARGEPPVRRSTPLVMIDPGHGGYDPGTEAAGTVAEKEVALSIALLLRDALNARGVNVQMTRKDDVFVSLGERTQMANRAHADLFISIHLNSSPDVETAGIESYYLNNTTDRATIRLAQMENGGVSGYGAGRGANLDYILTDLRQGYKANESASLARMIEAEAVADIDSDLGLTVNELGAKMGPFYVLVGAEMPAVLVECGFLSNPEEARRLTAPRYQQALADGIATAVVHYFNADAAVGNL